MTKWIEIGNIDDIPPLGSRVVIRADLKIAVFRAAQDRIYALENKCAHKGGPLSEGIVHDCRVTCPLHNWVFDMRNGKAAGADEGRVKTFPVKMSGRKILLSFSPLDEADAGSK